MNLEEEKLFIETQESINGKQNHKLNKDDVIFLILALCASLSLTYLIVSTLDKL